METILGFVALGVPAILIGGIVLGRSRPILLMYLAAVIVGLGYLFTTGTVDDVGKQAVGYIGTPRPASAPMPAMAPAPAPAETPAAAPEAAAPAPAETPPAAAPAPAAPAENAPAPAAPQ